MGFLYCEVSPHYGNSDRQVVSMFLSCDKNMEAVSCG